MIISLTLATGDVIYLAKHHVVSIRENTHPDASGSLVRMSNGDQWAVDEFPDDIISGWNIR